MKKAVLSLLLLLFSIGILYAQNLEGQWQGVLELPSAQMRITLRMVPERSGYATTIHNVYLGANRLKMSQVEVEGSHINIAVKGRNMRFEGDFVTPDSISGTAWHNANKMPLNLVRQRRPQTPRPPYPYQSLEIYFTGGQSHVTLAGTLTKPREGGCHPAILLITSGGAQNRDNEMYGHKPFAVLADHFTRQGFVVLRYDDRGVAHSSGSFGDAGFDELYYDAMAAYDTLAARAEVNRKKIFVLAQGEGGLMAIRLATQRPNIGGLILLGAPILPYTETILEQRSSLMRVRDVSEDLIAENKRWNRELQQMAMQYTDSETLRSEIKSKMEELLRNRYPDITAEKCAVEAARAASLYSTPWLRAYLRLDPIRYLHSLHCPIRAIYGAKDVMVPPIPHATALRRSTSRATVHILPGLNHLLQRTDGAGLPEDYNQIEQTLDPLVPEILDAALRSFIGKKP